MAFEEEKKNTSIHNESNKSKNQLDYEKNDIKETPLVREAWMLEPGKPSITYQPKKSNRFQSHKRGIKVTKPCSSSSESSKNPSFEKAETIEQKQRYFDEYNKKYRSKSLLEKHLETKKSTKRPSERVPFDRTQMGSNSTERLIQSSSQGLKDRFYAKEEEKTKRHFL